MVNQFPYPTLRALNDDYQKCRQYLNDYKEFGHGNSIFIGSSLIYFKKPIIRLNMYNHVHYEMTEKPNIWHRFWTRILLGWKWENINGN